MMLLNLVVQTRSSNQQKVWNHLTLTVSEFAFFFLQRITCCANQTQTARRKSFSGPTSPPSGSVKGNAKHQQKCKIHDVRPFFLQELNLVVHNSPFLLQELNLIVHNSYVFTAFAHSFSLLTFFLGDSHFLIRWPYAFRESEESKAWRWRHRLPAIPVRWRRRRWRWRRQQLCRWIHPVRDRFASWLPEGVWEEPAEWNKEGQWLWQWARSPIVGLFHRTL